MIIEKIKVPKCNCFDKYRREAREYMHIYSSCSIGIMVIEQRDKYRVDHLGYGLSVETNYCPQCGVKLGETTRSRESLEEWYRREYGGEPKVPGGEEKE